MILVAALLASPVATGCRRLERSILCELAPPVRAAPALPPRPASEAVAQTVRHGHRAAPGRVARSAAKPKPPTDGDVAHHVEALIAIADCTGARTLLVSAGHGATAENTYQACIGLPSAQVVPAPGAAAAASVTALGNEGAASPR